MKELIVLGSGGWIPTPKRETCCYLYRTNQTLVFLDTGTGMSNLFKYAHLLKDYNEINIVLSHYHLDHIIGLSFLLNWIKKEQKIIIWGPGNPYYKDGSKKIVSTIIGGDYFSRNIELFSNSVEIKDFPGDEFQINELHIKVFLQSHSSPSFGIKIDNSIYYATDTAVKEETFLNSKECSLLLHECWDISESSCKGKHSSLDLLLKFLQQKKDQQQRLIHLNPNWSQETERQINDIIKSHEKLKLAHDFEILSLS